MRMNPYLTFPGTCEEAFNFYQKSLGGEIVAMIRHEGSPMEQQMAPEWRKKIMHARLVIGENVLMGSDAPPEHQQAMRGFQVTLNTEKESEAERLFGALGEGATVHMPIQETFWAKRFGMLVDRFGTPWMVNCEKTP